jgi:hypothetical protein
MRNGGLCWKLENDQYEDDEMRTNRVLSGGAVACAVLTLAACGDKELSYEADVAPIIKQYCLECHAPPEGKGLVKSGQDMSAYDALMKGTKFGPTIKPKDSFTSALVMMIEGRVDPSIKMPHSKEPIPKDQIEKIKKWIDQGAKNN